MRKQVLVVALAVATAALAAPAQAAGGPWKVDVWHAGVPTGQVPKGSDFEVRGQGFHGTESRPVKVCVFNSQCLLVEPDRAGEFSLMRSLGTPGIYEIRVFQARNPHLAEWVLKATTEMTVTE